MDPQQLEDALRAAAQTHDNSSMFDKSSSPAPAKIERVANYIRTFLQDVPEEMTVRELLEAVQERHVRKAEGRSGAR